MVATLTLYLEQSPLTVEGEAKLGALRLYPLDTAKNLLATLEPEGQPDYLRAIDESLTKVMELPQWQAPDLEISKPTMEQLGMGPCPPFDPSGCFLSQHERLCTCEARE